MNHISRSTSGDEIQKFNRHAHDWWDENGSMKSLHDINPLRLSYIMDQVTLKGKRVLDVGCGGGILTEAIARQGADITGIDASADMIATARNHADASGLDIRYVQADITRMGDPAENGFDVIVVMELLEHVPDYTSVIQYCRNRMNPGGVLISATINRTPLAWFLAIICAEYLLGLLPRGTHEYTALIKPAELQDACRKAGLTLSNTRGFSYNPFTKRYYFCQNTLVNYMATFRLL